MSIEEKLVSIAENEHKVYDAGYEKGHADGEKSVVKYDNYALLFDFRAYESESFEVESDLARTYTTEYNHNASTQTKGLCSQNKNIKECKAIFPNATIARFAFVDCHNLERVTVDMTKIVDTFDGFTGFNSTFRWCYALKRVEGKISLLNCVPENTFDRCDSLEYVAFVPSSINKSLSLVSSPNLNDEGRQTVINGLADLTGTTTQTLTLHSSVTLKLTDEQINQIYAKNWQVG